MAIQANNLSELAEKMKIFDENKEYPENVSGHLTDWIDYYLWEGGLYSEIKNNVSEKTLELKHGGYEFPGFLFNSSLSGAEDRSFFGHIAGRIIKSGFIVKINDEMFDSSIINLRQKDKLEINNKFNSLSTGNGDGPFIRFEGYKNEKRTDTPKLTGKSKVNYLPSKADVERANNLILTCGGNLELEDVLNMIEKNCLEKGETLKQNWKMITERNIEMWFK